jgi:hypothetical protein
MAVGLDNADAPLGQPGALPAVLTALPAVLRELRLALATLLDHVGQRPAVEPYETLWLALVLDLLDARGERAVLTRRQGIRLRRPDGAIVRELVWGEGEQLVRYTAAGAHRLGVRIEGSKRAVLLSPEHRPGPGDRLTITSRRTIRSGFRAAEEYCEAFLERPTGRLDLTVRFPVGRPPRDARLVLASTETVLRVLRVRFGPDGRARVHCRLAQPTTAAIYSLRWRW